MRTTVLPAIMAAMACPAALYAGEATIADTLSLHGVEVAAPRKTSVELTPLTVTTVERTTIERSGESSLLPVLQGQVPGLFVSERGLAGYGVSGGAAGSVSIRGVGQGNKVLFMVDGQPQWAGVFGHALPDTYVANGVERVEVVRGPSSMLYGSNAMGGSVNIITRKAAGEGTSGSARAMFGSYNTQKMRASVDYRKERFGATAAGSIDRSNGNRKGSDFWVANEYVQLHYSLSDHWQTGANATLTQSKADNPGTTHQPLEGMWTDIARGTASLFLRNSYGHTHGGLQAYINWGAHTIDDGWTPGQEPTDYLFHSHDQNMGVTAFQTVSPWTAGDISLGFDMVRWGGSTYNTPKANPSQRESPFEEHENEVAGYVMMQQGLLGDRLGLNAGVRLHHSSQYGSVWVPQAGFILRPADATSVKFSWGRGFRSPTLRELYLYAPRNPDLRPESLWNYELELRHRALGGTLDAGVSLFFIDGSDMIQVQRIDGRPLNTNVGSFINKGFEVDAAWSPTRQWRFAANYSYLHTDAQVLYAPRHKLYAQAAFAAGQWELAVESTGVWGLLTGGPDESNYALLDLKAAYTLDHPAGPATLFLKLDNLTDSHYEVVYGCPMPGITIMGGVDFRF